MQTYHPEPFRIKMVEPLKRKDHAARLAALKKAHYNLFSLRSDDVYIDMLTDSGTGAMSDDQWSAMLKGDESYAGARGYFKLLDACEEIFAYDFIQPVHQGRAAEKVLYPNLLKPGQISVSNMHFDTTRGHVQLCGARPEDCVVQAARNTEDFAPFKGNMDLAALEALIAKEGAERIGVIIMTITNNSAGGQPVSMENIKGAAKIAKAHGIPYVIDAARYAENALYIKEREAGYGDHSLSEITKEAFSYADAFTMSAKKDGLVNMGGLVGVRKDAALFTKVQALTVPHEGFVSYGGLAGRDLEALAIGLKEGLDEDFLRYYLGQTSYLGDKLRAAGVPIQYPTGGHAIFVDARKMLPHIPSLEFPAHALCLALYEQAGIRGCSVGTFMLDLDPVTGEQPVAAMDFARFCIPRRVYTQAHLDYVGKALIDLAKHPEKIKGYRIDWQAQVLRHFTARLSPLA